MPTELPIACTLSAAELPERLAEMRAVGQDALRSAETTDSLAVLRFRASAATRQRLAAIVAAESECCAFLGFDLTDEPDVLRLTIRAPKGGEPVMHELVGAFRGESVVPS